MNLLSSDKQHVVISGFNFHIKQFTKITHFLRHRYSILRHLLPHCTVLIPKIETNICFVPCLEIWCDWVTSEQQRKIRFTDYVKLGVQNQKSLEDVVFKILITTRRDINMLVFHDGQGRAVFPTNTFLRIFSCIRILMSRFFYERKVRG